MEDQDRDHISSRSNFSGRSDQELDEMLDELRAGKIGINQPGQNSSEHDPQRGDIAIFIYPDDEAKGIKTYYVKRIIGMPGDTIDIVDGKVYLNGSDTPLDEPYLHEPMEPEEPQHYEVPDGCYFMLGDNRNYSNDARRWTHKYVKRDKLVAKVLFQYFPKIQKLN